MTMIKISRMPMVRSLPPLACQWWSRWAAQ